MTKKGIFDLSGKVALITARRGYVLQTGNIVLQGEAKGLLYSEHVKKAYLGQ